MVQPSVVQSSEAQSLVVQSSLVQPSEAWSLEIQSSLVQSSAVQSSAEQTSGVSNLRADPRLRTHDPVRKPPSYQGLLFLLHTWLAS